MPRLDQGTLQAALVGYQAELAKIEAAISAIRKQLVMRGVKNGAAKRTLSPEAKAKLAANLAKARAARAAKVAKA